MENTKCCIMYRNDNFTTNLQCWSQLKHVDSYGIWALTFGVPVCRSTCWAIKSTGIGGEFFIQLKCTRYSRDNLTLSMRIALRSFKVIKLIAIGLVKLHNMVTCICVTKHLPCSYFWFFILSLSLDQVISCNLLALEEPTKSNDV